MLKVTLTGDSETLDLDEISSHGEGVEAVAGLTGFGLPPVNASWQDLVQDGSIHRHTGYGSREFDIPLQVYTSSRSELKAVVERVARVMAGEMTMRIYDLTTSTEHWVTVHRVGGGTYIYGVDTDGEYHWSTTVTLRAGSPYLNRGASMKSINMGSAGDAIQSGSVIVSNYGSVPVRPVINIDPPGSALVKRVKLSMGDKVFEWSHDWEPGGNGLSTLVIDMETGTVTNADRTVNYYTGVHDSPQRLLLPPGIGQIYYELDMSASVTGVPGNISFQERDWMVI